MSGETEPPVVSVSPATTGAPEPVAGKVEPPPAGQIDWGVYRTDAPYRRAALHDLEVEVGRRPAIVMWYQEWEGRPLPPVADIGWLHQQGIVPMITWEAWKPAVGGSLAVEQPEYRLARITAGEFDEYITAYAIALRDLGGPVLLRPFHEMDGFWYPWGGLVNGNTPTDLVAAWRHVHDLFDAVGASNVTWVWSVNHLSVPNTAENSIDRYWPGSEYVDWIGISGFNFGASSGWSSWISFHDIYTRRLVSLRGYDKPVMLTELAAPEVGGDKAAWIEDAFREIPTYKRIRVVVWYDRRDSSLRDWRIDSSPEALAAFRKAVRGRDVLSAPAAFSSAFAG